MHIQLVSGAECCWMHTLTVLLLLALALLAGGLVEAVAAGAPAARSRREVEEAVFCVARPEADSSKLQEALDWTCGLGNSMGSVDCSAIQSGGSCFQPDSLADHASYAFTLYYYHQNAASHACDFKGLATLTSSNPSSGTCVYPTSQSSANMSSSSPSDGGSVPSPTTGSSPLFPILSSPAPSPSGAPAASLSFLSCAQVVNLVLMTPLALLLL